MKKVIITLAVLLFLGTTQSQAQELCGNCQAKQAPQQPAVFTPVICEPIAIGSWGRRIGYLKEVPTGTPYRAICYIYLAGTDGKIYEKGYPMEWVSSVSRPGDYLFGTDPTAPYKYLQPREIPVTIQVKAVLDAYGRQVVNSDGTYAVIYDITY